ncbi:hypothetical protein HDU91_004744 [Kappamyces sp. JEL0680]|nr:hypothetical protein HDU91_004744 [Kappamyces sp. JEL0680]
MLRSGLAKCSFSTTRTVCSKIGRTVVKLAPETSVQLNQQRLVVKGEKDELSLLLPDYVHVEIGQHIGGAGGKTIQVSVLEEKNEKQRAMWGTVRALIQRMVTGVQDGYTLSLRMVGVGYRALMEEGKLSLKIGVSHPVLLEIPAGIRVSIPAPQRIILQGADWPKITQFAAQIREWRKPEPYNQKGIFVGDETIKPKAGKKR